MNFDPPIQSKYIVEFLEVVCRHPVNGQWVEGHIVGHNEEKLRSMVRFLDGSTGWINDEYVMFELPQKRLI